MCTYTLQAKATLLLFPFLRGCIWLLNCIGKGRGKAMRTAEQLVEVDVTSSQWDPVLLCSPGFDTIHSLRGSW